MPFGLVLRSFSAVACLAAGLALGAGATLADAWQDENSCSSGYHKESGTDDGVPYVTCVPDGGGSAGGGYVDPGPSPEELALRNALPRFIDVIKSVSGSLPFLEANSWLGDLPQTPQQFVTDSDNVHRILIESAASLNAESTDYQHMLDQLDAWTSEDRRRLQELSAKTPALEEQLKEAKAYGPWYQRQIDNLDRATAALKGLSGTYRGQIEKDQKIVAATFSVLLPAAASPDWSGNGIVEPEAVPPTDVPSEPPFDVGNIRQLTPLPALSLPEPSYRKVDANVPPLADGFDERASRLEADAQAARDAFEHRNDLMHQTQYRQADFEDAQNALEGAIEHYNSLVEDIFGQRTVAERLRSQELAASDAMRSETARFMVYAAQSWIWENAKMSVLENIKYELKEQDYYGHHTDAAQSPILDVNESDILKYYEDRKFNILNLPDRVQSTVGLRDLRNQIMTLLTHAEDYATVVSRLDAYGTESDSRAFSEEMEKGLGKDSEALVKADLGSVNVPEPFGSIMAKYFLKN